HALMQQEALDTLRKKIIPMALILTPNIPEAETIAKMSIRNVEDMKKAAAAIYAMGAKNVLVKGGHLDGDAVDVLYDGQNYSIYSNERIDTKNTHGTGCTYSSAIAANLAKGLAPMAAVQNAKDYVTTAIRYSLAIGKGHGPTNHFYELYKKGNLI
ncbi:MAG: bifunctional hydroxymethylpyrimidine kinase/phosphomethylpyrimidine kinase, partial [Clostridia bacterium]|nr:bifunctional hydroxymethylpyrimidine kinase/phosphomethylpyrimidine kinase [Clostridia bacterium]